MLMEFVTCTHDTPGDCGGCDRIFGGIHQENCGAVYMVSPLEVVLYLHGDSESNVERAQEQGMPEEVVEMIGSALHEVKVTLLISPETGRYAIKSFEEL